MLFKQNSEIKELIYVPIRYVFQMLVEVQMLTLKIAITGFGFVLDIYNLFLISNHIEGCSCGICSY